jgi:hypothetical protein
VLCDVVQGDGRPVVELARVGQGGVLDAHLVTWYGAGCAKRTLCHPASLEAADDLGPCA